MGTRADFYVKKQDSIEWIGSTAWDGYGVGDSVPVKDLSKASRDNRDKNFLESSIKFSKSEEEYREFVTEYFNQRDDVTIPSDGWPWPWNNSKLTDETYVFDVEQGFLLRMKNHDGNHEDSTTLCHFAPAEYRFYDEYDNEQKVPITSFLMPDMSHIKNVQIGGNRSGLLVFGLKK